MNRLGSDVPERRVLALPGGSVVLEAGALRYLTVGGDELIRGLPVWCGTPIGER